MTLELDMLVRSCEVLIWHEAVPRDLALVL